MERWLKVMSVVMLMIAFKAVSSESAEDISKKLADPTSDIWAVFTAFQATNYSGNAVDGSEWGSTILVELVMPITFSSSLKLLLRPALPIAVGLPTSNGDMNTGNNGNQYSGVDKKYVLGNMQLPLMLSPITSSKFTWGLAHYSKDNSML